eukprot:6466204-Amphidinium_carterae.1
MSFVGIWFGWSTQNDRSSGQAVNSKAGAPYRESSKLTTVKLQCYTSCMHCFTLPATQTRKTNVKPAVSGPKAAFFIICY